MIGFSLSEDQEQLRARARAFAETEIKPAAAHHDRTGEFPIEIMQKAFDAKLMSEGIPKEYDGPGLSNLDAALMTEELGAACMGIGTCIMANSLALAPIILFGGAAQKERYLRPHARAFRIAAFALTEREAGSDAGAAKTTAVRDGDHYVINGDKCFCTNGGFADFYVVFASTNPDRGPLGMSAFIVERDMGVEVGKAEDKMGQRASNQVELHFRDVRVPTENLLLKEGRGFQVAMGTLDRTRAGTAAGAVGIARRALEEAVKYANERVQFGAPIVKNQAIQFKLADMAMKVEAARLLAWQAAWMADHGVRQTKEAAMAKCYAGDVAMEVTTEAVQILGGRGYSREYPVEKLMRDAKLMQIYEGTQEIQRLVIAREVAKGR
ncbi:MAG TPA: acyl-CoA dehydrogenase family protein [Candidatus Hydrogenedentes bacterium]|nr:acyl-CoA dehydrogenase family protein [Candidatus Hydrogenedentota bacterium]HNT88897.1 acyl-CoA dehydrogenase family protein [Candidatus Hydrogenedentota bacterium]